MLRIVIGKARNAAMLGAMLTAGLISGHAAAQIATNSRITSPVIVSTNAQMTQGSLSGTQLDAPMSTYTVVGTRYWLMSEWNHAAGGILHSLTQGSLDAPHTSIGWTKATCNRNASNFCVNGANTAFTTFNTTDSWDLWFVNLYQPQPNDGGLLAFVHEERVGGSGGVSGNNEGKTRIGLAWSSDNGNTWAYLGRILSAYGDPQPHNIQGLPYLVKDGYFYVYYTEAGGIAVARANVSSVIAAAKSGGLGSNLWQKHYNGSFSEPGLGGQFSPIGPWGITHTQAVHSTYTGKYYLALTFMAWTGINSTVKLYESSDAINWTHSMTLADEPAATLRPDGGYQYCSIADRNGAPNAQAGQYLYVYCLKDPYMLPRNFALYRWQVNLGASVDSFRQSADYTSVQGPYWWYQRGDGTNILDMSWQGSYWVGVDSWARIFQDIVHPGTVEMPVLKWVAPKAGAVRIRGTVRDADVNCGDGISASVMHNGTQIFAASVGNSDTVGTSINLARNVAAGDGLFFIVSKGSSTNYCDSTRWDPSVDYE